MRRSSEGMKANGVGMAEAASDVVGSTVRVLNDESTLPVDVVDMRGEPDLQDSMMDMKRHSYGHLANGRVLRASDDALESLLDVLHPGDAEKQ